MADEAIVFSLTTAEMAAGNVNSEAGGKAVDITEQDATVMTSSVDIGLYYLKAAYDGGEGRNKLLQHIDKIKAAITEAAWPAI